MLALDEKSEARIIQGDAFLRRMIRTRLLGRDQEEIDNVLGLTSAKTTSLLSSVRGVFLLAGFATS